MTNLSPYAWTRRFDEPAEFIGGNMRIDLRLVFKMLPAIFALYKTMRESQKMGLETIINPFEGGKVRPVMGVPLGGLGGGTITRGWQGDFVRWQMRPGRYRFGEVAADQFSLRVRRAGAEPQCMVLNPNAPAGEALNEWKWDMPRSCGTYAALYPRAWTVYEQPLPGVRLTCRQVSPVIPHNYKESSYPAGVFVWTVENTGDTPAEISLMFTFQNGSGDANDQAGGHSNHLFSISTANGDGSGIVLKHAHRQPKPWLEGKKPAAVEYYEDPLSFAIATRAAEGVEVSYRTRFITNSNGLDVWGDFAADGQLENYVDDRPSSPGLTIGAALCAQVEIPAGESRQVAFSLAWDMPIARFGWGTGWYRRYTRFYGRGGDAAARIAVDALNDYPAWETAIEAWQKPILDDPALPDWYKSTLFNETYYLADGGTVWTAGKENDVPTAGDALPESEIGHFAYLESYEYTMYNTYDVHFYSSFALAALWPELELSIQRDFARSIRMEHPEVLTMFLSGMKAPRKVRGAIPHDLGAPSADPWQQVNAYTAQDASRWKDLNPKFVLQVYRDYIATGNLDFLKEVWDAVQESIRFVSKFDKDGDGMLENEGYPDQTYDVWSASGPSAYTGGLWLACLSAAAAMALALDHEQEAQDYLALLEKGQAAYEKLWNGEYYNYDSSRSKHHDSIMADQLAGQWYARACFLPEIVPPEHARSAYQKVFDYNVTDFAGGERGAVNGMRPDGRIDRSEVQAHEMWLGTTFAVAAGMLHEGMDEQAFATAHGVYQALYHDFGLWFQSPEAINSDDSYRAVGYMRPLSIWAMQWAWDKRK